MFLLSMWHRSIMYGHANYGAVDDATKLMHLHVRTCVAAYSKRPRLDLFSACFFCSTVHDSVSTRGIYGPKLGHQDGYVRTYVLRVRICEARLLTETASLIHPNQVASN